MIFERVRLKQVNEDSEMFFKYMEWKHSLESREMSMEDLSIHLSEACECWDRAAGTGNPMDGAGQGRGDRASLRR